MPCLIATIKVNPDKVEEAKKFFKEFAALALASEEGTLTYTWARKGQQPTGETSGKRKAYKVLGLIDYFSGRFFSQCQEKRLNSETYAAFLEEVLAKSAVLISKRNDEAVEFHSAKIAVSIQTALGQRHGLHPGPTEHHNANGVT